MLAELYTYQCRFWWPWRSNQRRGNGLNYFWPFGLLPFRLTSDSEGLFLIIQCYCRVFLFIPFSVTAMCSRGINYNLHLETAFSSTLCKWNLSLSNDDDDLHLDLLVHSFFCWPWPIPSIQEVKQEGWVFFVWHSSHGDILLLLLILAIAVWYDLFCFAMLPNEKGKGLGLVAGFAERRHLVVCSCQPHPHLWSTLWTAVALSLSAARSGTCMTCSFCSHCNAGLPVSPVCSANQKNRWTLNKT